MTNKIESIHDLSLFPLKQPLTVSIKQLYAYYLMANMFDVINQDYHDNPKQHKRKVTPC